MKRKIILMLCFFNIHIKRTIILDINGTDWLCCPICKKYLNNEFKWIRIEKLNNDVLFEIYRKLTKSIEELNV